MVTKKHDDDDAPVVDDSNVRRNLQADSASETQGPQMFTKEQLPDPAVALAAGLAPQAIPANQILDGDEAFSHPRGPEPGEQVRAEQRRAVIDRVVENDDVPGVDVRTLSETAVDAEATSAVGRALQKRAEGDDDVKRDEAGREIDPEGVQEDSRELAEKKDMVKDNPSEEEKGKSAKDKE